MFDKIQNIVKKDLTIYIICAIALLCCLFTMLSIGSYRDAINKAWLDQWMESGCGSLIVYKPTAVNISFKIMGDYDVQYDHIGQDLGECTCK